MKEYEVVREIFNTCSMKYRLDTHFCDEWETDDIEKLIASWYGGTMPDFTKEVQPDGTIVYTLNLELPERYSFTEIL